MSLSAHTLFSALFPYLQSIHKITLQLLRMMTNYIRKKVFVKS